MHIYYGSVREYKGDHANLMPDSEKIMHVVGCLGMVIWSMSWKISTVE